MADPKVTLDARDLEVNRAEVLGTGGRFTVFAGRYKGKPVALKVISDACQDPLVKVEDDLWKEFQALSKLDHPHIVQGIGTTRWEDHNFYLAMERLDLLPQMGPKDNILSLAENIKICQEKHHFQHARDWDEATRHLIAQLCHALDAAHARGVVHNDLKPDNIFVQLIGGELKVKLCDFDAAGEDNPRGRPEYTAPERFDVQPATPATDIYSLGILLYHLLTGTLPYPEQDPVAARNARTTRVDKLTGERQRAAWRYIRNFPEVARILPRMLAHDPADRPSMKQILRDLKLSDIEVDTGRRGLQWVYAAAAIIALALLGTLAWPLDDSRLSQMTLGRQSQEACSINLSGHLEAFCNDPKRPGDCAETIERLSKHGMCSTRVNELSRCNRGP